MRGEIERARVATAVLKRLVARRLAQGSLLTAAIYVVLLIPDADPPPPRTPGGQPFVWERDEFWAKLEREFVEARGASCDARDLEIRGLFAAIEPTLLRLELEEVQPDDRALPALETDLFRLAPWIAACPDRMAEYVSAIERVRQGIKRQSERWTMSDPARRALYRLLYGSRAALEEVLLQAPRDAAPALCRGVDEPSAAPAIELHGVRLHSGDVLVSRGAAPTSALIARGHDLPGNFSHVALLHVEEATGRGSVVEAHSESGVVVATIDEYLSDVKLRILALRPRSDLTELVRDPLLPHRAAARALESARARHIPYDFAMDPRDHSALFCSEVAAAAYEAFGVELWPGLSTISSPGVASWLAAFGVKNFEFQEPSDLEYDPKLRVVAEWRDPEALFQDHVDNAIVDARLERAEDGARLGYAWPALPLARVLKGWSALLNRFGRVGPAPEGMSATAGLRNVRFAREHAAIRERLLALASEYERERGHRAPYYELLRLARQAAAEVL